MGLEGCVLSSLTGLVLYSRHNPAMNRWAIFERPSGTRNHDTLNRCVSAGPVAARWQCTGTVTSANVASGRAAAGASRTAALPDRDCVRRTSRRVMESHWNRGCSACSACRHADVLRLVFDTAAFRTLGSKIRFTVFFNASTLQRFNAFKGSRLFPVTLPRQSF